MENLKILPRVKFTLKELTSAPPIYYGQTEIYYLTSFIRILALDLLSIHMSHVQITMYKEIINISAISETQY